MTAEFEVQKAGLHGKNWITICRATEAKAREVKGLAEKGVKV